MPSVVLVNDTSLYATHFGCQLVGQTIREQLSRVGLNLAASFPLRYKAKIARPYFEAADLVIINAEGSIHHGRNVQLLELANDYPCALINGVFDDNGFQSNLRRFHYISMRESLSANEIRRQSFDCEVVPDLIFDSMLLSSIPRGCSDIPVGLTDNVINPMAGFSPKSDLAYTVLSNLARCKTLCAGRFHAAIAAAVLRIPFSTWESNTWKIRGMMQDMGVEHLHFKTQAEAIDNVPAELDPKIDAFVDDARLRVRAMFEKLVDIASFGRLKQVKSA